MNKIKKTIIALMLLALPLFICACYQPDLEYEAVDPGQLQGPSVDRNSSEYRTKYATLEKYAEPVTIDVAVTQFDLEAGVKKGTTPENQSFNKIAKDVLNIELNYVVVGSSTSYDQKLGLYLSSGKMPDMFYTTNSSLYSQLLEDGKLADLSDVFWYLNDELQENYLEYFRELLPTTMIDGALYSLPTITNNYTSAQRLYIRQDWLDIVGKEAPTTIEEMLEVGQAFVDNREEIARQTGIVDEKGNPQAKRIIPFTINKELTWAGSYSVEGFLNCFGTSMDAYFEGEDGELYYSNTSPQMKAALTCLRDMFSRKILDNEFISKSAEQIQANIKAGYVGMAFGEWWMAKDVLDESITNVDGANWTWVDIPSASGIEAKPIVSSVAVSGYNLVSKDCEHPEAVARLINLFYDIYYSDDAQDKYGPAVLPSNGFYYQFVPIKLWDGIASMREYYRVQEVFENLYKAGFDPADYVDSALYQQSTILQLVSTTESTDYVVSVTDDGTNIINRDVINAINANPTWKAEFDKLRNREKTLHFVDGYPYYVALSNGKSLSEMSKSEKRGWGIYHEMIDPTGGYAYVVNLTEGKAQAAYDCFYGANLSAMLEYSEYISTQTNVMFTKIITGQMDINKFESDYVKGVFENNGGDKIMNQVNQWYKSHNIDYDKVYGLIS